MPDLATAIMQRHAELLTERAAQEAAWRKLVRYVIPQEADSWGVNPDGPRDKPTVDDTARECLDNLVAGLDEMLFRRDPFEVVPRGDDQSRGYAGQWADYATHNLNVAIDHPFTGFTTARQAALRSVAGLGHGCIFLTEKLDRHLCVKYEPASEIVIAEDAYGRVDTRFRRYEMTARQMVERWGNRISQQVRVQVDRTPGIHVQVLHAVYPRYEVPSSLATNMPWASVYIETATKNLLEQSGFLEFPFAIPRWNRRGTGPYGWPPGLTVLDEILRLNAMGRSNLNAGQYAADPEVYVPDGMFRRSLATARRPGAIHSYDSALAMPGAEVRRWPGAEGLPFLLEMEHDRRNAVREAFFYYILQPPESPNMTATEWIGRQQQMARRMGAPVSQLEQEMGEPIAKRFFAMLVRIGVIQPPANGMRLQDFEVRFRSITGQGRKLGVAESMQRTLESAAAAAQFDPQAVHVIDAPEMIRTFAESYGAPPNVLVSPDVLAARQAQAQQQQQLAALGQTAMTGATVAKLAAEATRSATAGGGGGGG